MLSKIYFPRIVFPLSAIVVSLVDVLGAALLLIATMLWFGIVPGWRVLAILPLLAACLALALAIGLWAAVLNVRYRDFRFLVPFAMQLGFYISPVGYDSAIIPESWRVIFSLNPAVGIIDGFRWAMLGADAPLPWPAVSWSFAFAFGMLAWSVRAFRRGERGLVDIL
jgi:lipopolysaccharide transport system permease protein